MVIDHRIIDPAAQWMEFAVYRESIGPVAARQIVGRAIPSCWCFFARWISFRSRAIRVGQLDNELRAGEWKMNLSRLSRENMNFFCEYSLTFVQPYLLSPFEREIDGSRRQVSSTNSTRVKVSFSKHLRLIERVIER